MHRYSRMVGVVCALGMLVFSAFIYVRTGDWVALPFILGSVGYLIFFWTSPGGSQSP